MFLGAWSPRGETPFHSPGPLRGELINGLYGFPGSHCLARTVPVVFLNLPASPFPPLPSMAPDLQLTRCLVCSGHILSLQPPLHCLECPHFAPHLVVLTAFTRHIPKNSALPPSVGAIVLQPPAWARSCLLFRKHSRASLDLCIYLASRCCLPPRDQLGLLLPFASKQVETTGI